MHSISLSQRGLSHYVAGAAYDFRFAKVGERLAGEFQRALDHMQLEPACVYSASQVHGVNIEYCDGLRGEPFLYGKVFPETDGLITDRPDVALLIKYADCTPIVLFDPIKKVQAVLHSGWRGTVQEIGAHALEKMTTEFQCRREDLVVYLGPSIDQANYEVGLDVYEAFKHFPTRDQFFRAQGEKFLLSMSQANLALLLAHGLKKEQIEVSHESTFLNPALHSARAEGPEYGLNSLITMM